LQLRRVPDRLCSGDLLHESLRVGVPNATGRLW